jgi:hypothetical protein
MNNSLIDYWEALERLKANKPLRVPRDTRITNDSVSLEAGRGKGSIKKSRPAFAALIAEIEIAAIAQAQCENIEQVRLDKAKETSRNYRLDLEAALEREVSLILELYSLKKQLSAITGQNVLPIRPQGKKSQARDGHG